MTVKLAVFFSSFMMQAMWASLPGSVVPVAYFLMLWVKMPTLVPPSPHPNFATVFQFSKQ